MIKRKHLNPAQLPDWSGMFSQIVTVEKHGLRFLYISGQVGVDETKNIVGSGSFEEQTGQAFKNLIIALSTAGAGPEDVVKLNVYVVQYKYSHAALIKEAIEQNFTANQLPALSLIGVAALAEERFLIEIEATAVVEISG